MPLNPPPFADRSSSTGKLGWGLAMSRGAPCAALGPAEPRLSDIGSAALAAGLGGAVAIGAGAGGEAGDGRASSASAVIRPDIARFAGDGDPVDLSSVACARPE